MKPLQLHLLGRSEAKLIERSVYSIVYQGDRHLDRKQWLSAYSNLRYSVRQAGYYREFDVLTPFLPIDNYIFLSCDRFVRFMDLEHACWQRRLQRRRARYLFAV